MLVALSLPRRCDQLRSPFTNSVCWHLRMTAMQRWHYGAVCHPQPFHSSNLQLVVQHRHRVTVFAHLRGPRSVIARCRMLPSVIFPLRPLGVSMMPGVRGP
jgi:hypothetical protein